MSPTATASKTRSRSNGAASDSGGAVATDGTPTAESLGTASQTAAVDPLSTAVMMVDQNLVLYYMNGAARDLMSRAEATFQAVWPNFRADALIGQCIDRFHKDPSHQRRLLGDPTNLPYRATIEVEGLSFGLVVTAQYNDDGDHVGSILEWEELTELYEYRAKFEAVNTAQATIEFDLDGNVLTANRNFLDTVGYTLDEVQGRHHRMFVEPEAAADPSYRAFWDRLAQGDTVTAEFRRVAKSGQLVWLQASYSSVLNAQGKPVKFFKVATDITEQKLLRQKVDEIVGRTSEVMEAVAGGDLTQTIGGDYDGGLGQLQQATNASIENLSGLVHRIRNSAASMSTSAQEVASANLDLSRRTEAQASSLEQTASSMEEMTSTVQQNADNARQASQLAVSAREQATDGGDVVEQAVEAMRAISESSKKIADIIGVIDEIAFQTNLLALNAAVEAARAGDQGRGFAVVASEVRNLAQRSAGAAKEIKALIQDSLEKVDDGSDLVNRSGSQLAEIVSSVKKVSDIIGEIAAASEEQSSGISQVNQAVATMDQGTQQNAAMVEEAAAAAESVQQQSHALLVLTERFKIQDSSAFYGEQSTTVASPTPRPSTAPSDDDWSPGSEAAQVRAGGATPPADDDVWNEF